MAIAYGIALGMDWEKPLWAGFAVAMISLATTGQSLNKAAMRVVGTLAAFVVSLALLAFFHQDRWLLMAALSLYVGFCTYKFTGKTYQYAWFVSAFVCAVILVSAGSSSEEAFGIAVERVQETGTGVVVYGLISAFLWPQTSRTNLEDAGRKLTAVQHQLFQGYRLLMDGQGTAEAYQAQRLQVVGLTGQLARDMAAAETDSYSVWEVRHLWRHFRDDATALGEAMERWRESFPEIQELNLSKLFPDIEAFCDELEARLSAIEAILAGEAPAREPQGVVLTVDRTELRGLSHFQQAAAAVTKVQLERIEQLTRALFEVASVIKSFAVPSAAQRRSTASHRPHSIDPDRLIAVVRVVATLWAAFLLWVYIDPPGHVTFVQLAVTFAMVAAMMNLQRAAVLFIPFVIGCAIGGLCYVFIMPQLSGYTQLGLMIFLVTAAIYYVFWQPRQGLMKNGAIVPFMVLISAQNQQTYDFASYANSAAMLLLAVLVVAVFSYIPTSPRGEKVFLRLFARFFQQVDFLLARIAIDWEQRAGLSGRVQASLNSGDLIELSQKLSAASQAIDHRSFPDNSPASVQALVTSMSAVAFRMKELVDSREHPQAELLVTELLDDLRDWRLAMQAQLRLWAEDPASAAQQSTDLKERMDQRLAKLEARIEETFQNVGEGALDAKDYENFYRLLGSFRGLSEAGLAFVDIARSIDWRQWREARF